MTVPPPHQPGPTDPAAFYGGPVRFGPPPVPPVSGLAIASFVLSLVCLAPLGLVLGIVALFRISRSGERGKGFAVAGVAVSGVVLTLAIGMVTGLLNFSFRSFTTEGGPVRADGAGRSVFALKVGDCFTPGTELTPDSQGSLKDGTAARLPCEAPHRGEIYGSFALTDEGAFPGLEEVRNTSREQCGELLLDYAPDVAAFGPLQTYFYHPDRSGWARGGRTVLCWAGRPQGEIDESIRRDESDFEPAQYAYVSAFRPLFEAQAQVPGEGPDQNLTTAKVWAGRMAGAYAESARLLSEAKGGLPGEVRGRAGELAEVFEAGVPHWERASRAADVGAFRAALGQAESGAKGTEGLDAEIRTGLGLPVPGGGQPAEDAGV